MRSVGVEIVGAIGRRPERRVFAKGVSIDSRTVRPGEVFFALEGRRCDGHSFVVRALRKGAAAAVVHRDVDVPQEFRERVIRVPDTLRALGESARLHRRRWDGTVIAVTGSNGKTTTRDMIFHILSAFVPCKCAPASFNTNVGVPLTLFCVEPGDQVVVVEMGTNAPGEIRELAGIAEPDLGVITNVGESHLEGLGSVEGVARAKAELLEGLRPDGVAVLNADDPWFAFLSGRWRGEVISYGVSSGAAFRGRAVRPLRDGHWFVVDGVGVRLGVPGLHNVQNALAALAVARRLGVDLSSAGARLREFRLPPLRCQMEIVRDVTVIADCYNANPASMRAALELLRDLPVAGRRVALLGDMLELGAESARLHERLGAELLRYEVDVVYAVGRFAGCLADAAAKHGLDGAARAMPTLDEATGEICTMLRPGDALLIKGSRGMAMERFLDQLRGDARLSA